MNALEQLDAVDVHVGNNGLLRERINPMEYFNEQQFKNRYRLSKASVNLLNDLLQPYIHDPNQPWALTRLEKLLIGLRCYASGSIQSVIGDFANIDNSTASRAITVVTEAICNLRPQWIRRFDDIATTMNGFYQISAFPQVIGCVDGSHIKMYRPAEQNADDYINRKGFYSINAQFVCDHRLRIIDLVARWPGSVHDSRIFYNSMIRNELETNEANGLLLGDNGYPCNSYILTPVLRPNTVRQQRYNMSHKSTRSTIERCFGILKRRFLALHYGLRLSPLKCCNTIVACSILHNFVLQHDGNDDNANLPNIILDNVQNDLVPQEAQAVGAAFRNTFINNHFN